MGEVVHTLSTDRVERATPNLNPTLTVNHMSDVTSSHVGREAMWVLSTYRVERVHCAVDYRVKPYFR